VNMLDGTAATLDYISFARDASSRQKFSLTAPASAILVATALAAAWMAHVRLVAPDFAKALEPVAERILAANPYGALIDPGFSSASAALALDARLAFAKPAAPAPEVARASEVAAATKAPNPFGGVVNPGFVSGSVQVSEAPRVIHEARLEPIVAAAPAPPARPVVFEPVASAPLPPARPAGRAPLASAPPAIAPAASAPVVSARLADRRVAPKARIASPVADNRTFFQKLFGMAASPAPVAVSYAAAEVGPASSLTGPSVRYDRWTAVYDVAAHVVYMPNGTRLEAHSGLGEMLDDPRHVNERMRGATPPNVYALAPREELFHGVLALRMNPVGPGDVFGRAGLLAHSYMLGPNGDSNGCVSFKDYDAFLQAYQSGQIKRLAVVARLD
jgi:Protein of unknown function (DUF2778)